MERKRLGTCLLFFLVFLFVSIQGSIPKVHAAPDTLTLRPNADGTYSTWNEVPNSGYVFSNQFEEGDFSAWTGSTTTGTSTITVESTTPHHGSYDAKIVEGATANDAFAYKTITAASTIYFRLYLKTPSSMATSDQIRFARLAGAGSTSIFGMYLKNDAGTLKWGMRWRSGTTLQALALSAQQLPSTNTYYCVEGYANVGTSVAAYDIWVNGNKLTDLTQSGLTQTTTITTVQAGLSGDNVGTATYYIDCAVISSSYIGVESRKDLVNDSSDNTALIVTSYTGEDVSYTLRKASSHLQDHTIETGTITSVTVWIRAMATGATAVEKLRMGCRTYGTDYEDVETTVARDAFANYECEYLDNPNTTEVWTWTEVDALEVVTKPSTLAVTESITVSEVWIEVLYVAGAVGEFTYTLTATIQATSTLVMLQEKAFLSSQTFSVIDFDGYWKESLHLQSESTTALSALILIQEKQWGLTSLTSTTTMLEFGKEIIGELIVTISEVFSAAGSLAFLKEVGFSFNQTFQITSQLLSGVEAWFSTTATTNPLTTILTLIERSWGLQTTTMTSTLTIFGKEVTEILITITETAEIVATMQRSFEKLIIEAVTGSTYGIAIIALAIALAALAVAGKKTKSKKSNE